MYEGKMREMPKGMEHKYIRLDSEKRIPVSALQIRKEKERTKDKRSKSLFKGFVILLISTYISETSLIFLKEIAYSERGYEAFGGEYLAAFLIYIFIIILLKKLMEGEIEND